MVEYFHSAYSALGAMWCQAMHSETTWPVKGEYECKTCHRRYPVAWEAKTNGSGPAARSGKRMSGEVRIA
jgi:hypothetical protein